MEKLKQYIQLQLSYASIDPEDAKTNFDHAFGALELHLWLHPEAEAEITAYWDTIRPQFEKIMWGL